LRGRGKQGNVVTHTLFLSALYVATFAFLTHKSAASQSACPDYHGLGKARSTTRRHLAIGYWLLAIGLLVLSVFRFTNGLIIIGRIKLSPISAPGCLFDGNIHFAQTFSRNPQSDNLTDTHHHVPGNDFDSGRWECLVIALPAQFAVNSSKGFD
jgi:hypothetical protein